MSDENNMYENKMNENNVNQQPVNPQFAEQQPANPQYVNPQYTNQTANHASHNPYNGSAYRDNRTSGKGQETGLGIASMVCGIISIPAICITDFGIIFSFILGVVAVVLGIVQLVKNEKKGMAIAGIVCGSVGILICAVVIMMVVFFASTELYSGFMKGYNYY